MALLDLFSRRKKEFGKKPPRGKADRPLRENKKEEMIKKISTSEAKIAGSLPAVKASSLAAKTILAPHVTEKAVSAKSNNSYVFKVDKNANKILIKRAVEDLYGVNVERVNILTVPAKKRFVLGRSGKKSGYKKAIIVVKEGQAINLT